MTPDKDDDGTPRPCCNSYFESFAAIRDALVRVREATEERLVELAEKDQNFASWRDAYSIALGKGANTISNGIAIDWNSTAALGTGTAARRFASFRMCFVQRILLHVRALLHLQPAIGNNKRKNARRVSAV